MDDILSLTGIEVLALTENPATPPEALLRTTQALCAGRWAHDNGTLTPGTRAAIVGRIARNPATPTEALTALVEDGSRYSELAVSLIRTDIAEHPNTDEDTLRKIAVGDDIAGRCARHRLAGVPGTLPYVRSASVRSPRAPKGQLGNAALVVPPAPRSGDCAAETGSPGSPAADTEADDAAPDADAQHADTNPAASTTQPGRHKTQTNRAARVLAWCRPLATPRTSADGTPGHASEFGGP